METIFNVEAEGNDALSKSGDTRIKLGRHTNILSWD